MKKIKELMTPFGFSLGVVQDIGTLLVILEENNVRARDFTKYLDALKQDNIKAQKEWEESLPKCPSCGEPLHIVPVNTTPRNQTNDNSKSLWFCNKCDYEKYNSESAKDAYEMLTKKKEKE